MTTIKLFVGAEPDPDMATPNSLLKAWFMHRDEGLDTHLEFVADAAAADAVMVPMEWRSYEDDPRLDVPWTLARAAAAANKPFIVFSHTDLEPRLPFRQPVAFFRSGATRGKQPSNVSVFVVPAFIGAHFLDDTDVPTPTIPPRRPRPVVGFCGGSQDPHAFARGPRALVDHALVLARHTLSRRSRGYFGPEISALRTFRGEVLAALRNDDRVETDFVVRTEFRAGAAKDEAADHPSVIAFRDNLEHCDYALVVRGKGNFSIRMSEALRFGRIPLHIDTDDVLPYETTVDWRALTVSVPAADIGDAAARVRAHYDATSDDDLVAMQVGAYQLWKDRFTRQGFVNHFPEFMRQIAAR